MRITLRIENILLIKKRPAIPIKKLKRNQVNCNYMFSEMGRCICKLVMNQQKFLIDINLIDVSIGL